MKNRYAYDPWGLIDSPLTAIISFDHQEHVMLNSATNKGLSLNEVG